MGKHQSYRPLVRTHTDLKRGSPNQQDYEIPDYSIVPITSQDRCLSNLGALTETTAVPADRPRCTTMGITRDYWHICGSQSDTTPQKIRLQLQKLPLAHKYLHRTGLHATIPAHRSAALASNQAVREQQILAPITVQIPLNSTRRFEPPPPPEGQAALISCAIKYRAALE